MSTRTDTYIRHITLSTGHSRDSYRDEVDDDVVAMIGSLLPRAFRGEHVPVPGQYGYTMTGGVHGRCCIVTVWAASPAQDGPHLQRIPVVTFGVAARTSCARRLWESLHETPVGSARPVTRAEDVPPAPWCAARIDVGAAFHADALAWVADLERCVAWAWIER